MLFDFRKEPRAGQGALRLVLMREGGGGRWQWGQEWAVKRARGLVAYRISQIGIFITQQNGKSTSIARKGNRMPVLDVEQRGTARSPLVALSFSFFFCLSVFIGSINPINR